ncbi:hypothetical protein QQY24_33250 [Streptomyces sp. TG1A-8]|uniref:hypothetical protein n=1 Tax=Streptomyces sp. TG1A-8 TaxID=3051385 RepID=UPI00265C3EEB|nr:hypothetical protein [Streptomyces sp. TG1A-8]MDO0929959.1 hypothetical protein [Streptomyces sp. TG1A-8]
MGQLLLGAGQADLQALDLSEPAFVLSFGDPVEQVVADLDQTVSLERLGPEERTSDASVLVDARRSEGPSAGSLGELALLEVSEEGVPLLVRRGRDCCMIG